jgi:uncharacterized protein YfaP (DUF2135 family)
MTTLSPPNIFEGAIDLGHLGALVGTSTRLPYPVQQVNNATYNPYFYRFTLDVSDAFFGLREFGGATYQLYNSNHELLNTGGSFNQTPLSAGTYYIRVTGAGAGDVMGLFAFRREIADPDANQRAYAVNLGNWSTTDYVQRSNQQLGVVYDRNLTASGSFTVDQNDRIIDDPVDWYRFTLTNTQTIDFTASGSYGAFVLTGQVNGNLGTTFTSQIFSGQRFTLQAGTYYLEVFDSQTSVSVGNNQLITFRQDKEVVDSYSFTLQHYYGTPPNRVPVVTAGNVSTANGVTIPASNLFSATDRDGNAITRYQLWDGTTAASSGHWVVNGVVQPAGQSIGITASQLAQTFFVTGSGADNLSVRAYDGQGWSAWRNFTVTAPVNHAPVVTAANVNVAHGQSLAASSLFSATDQDGNAITRYQLWDGTAAAASGHWVVNGVSQPTGQAIDVTAAQLSQTSFVSGSGTDTLWVRAFDGSAWSNWKKVTVTAPANHVPVVTPSNQTAAHGQTFAAANLFTVSDADGDQPVRYELWDSTASAASGHWVVNGVVQPAGQSIGITAAQFAQTSFASGSGTDTLWVRAFDGYGWSDWKKVTITAPPNHAPVATIADHSLGIGQTHDVTSWLSYTDADGDAPIRYEFWDGGKDASSGYFQTSSNPHHPAASAITVEAADLASVILHAGTSAGTETLWVRAFDGHAWGAWDSFVFTTTAATPPAPTDDYAANTSTTGQVVVGGSATGNLERTGDHDWFSVQLTGGHNYEIRLDGEGHAAGTLHDPYLRLYNASGTQVGFNDDGGGGTTGYDSMLTYTPTASGTFYVDAGAYSDSYAGTYRVSVHDLSII